MTRSSWATIAACSVSFNTQEAREPTTPDWALDTAKLGATLSDAQQTTATSPYLICKAWCHSAPSASFCHFHVQAPFVLSTETARWREERRQPCLKETVLQPNSINTCRLPAKKLHTHSTNPLSPHTHLSPAWLMCLDTRTSPVNWPNELTTAPA